MVYKIDNRPKRHQGRILVIGIILGIMITIGGFYWLQNTPNLIKMAGQAGNTISNISSNIKTSSVADNTNTQTIALQIHQLVNQERIKNGLPQLSWNNSISEVATAYSQYMLINNHYGHIDLNGNHANYRMEQNGITCGNNWAENLDWIGGGSNTYSPNDILSDWLSDSGHKNNLLNPNITEEGIGIYTDNKQTYITEDFC